MERYDDVVVRLLQEGEDSEAGTHHRLPRRDLLLSVADHRLPAPLRPRVHRPPHRQPCLSAAPRLRRPPAPGQVPRRKDPPYRGTQLPLPPVIQTHHQGGRDRRQVRLRVLDVT